MPRSSKERSEGYQERYSEAPSSVADDNESSAETITPPMTMEALKARCEELNKQTKELETRLQKEKDKHKEKESTPFSTTSFPSSSSSGDRRSQKLPDPPLFTDGIEPTWEDWQGKIRDKIEINADHFNGTKAVLAYIHSRIAGEAAKATLARRQRGSLNPYLTANELLDELSDLYEDPDKENNYRREYSNLYQGLSKFSEFYAVFQRLSSYLGYNDKQLMADLREKISNRLRMAWGTLLIKPATLREVRAYLV